jgi:hypothetical protein
MLMEKRKINFYQLIQVNDQGKKRIITMDKWNPLGTFQVIKLK